MVGSGACLGQRFIDISNFQKIAPLAKGGYLYLPKTDRSVRIEQIQLEQDTAKTNYDEETAGSIVDLNRAGSALMEIVSRPDIR